MWLIYVAFVVGMVLGVVLNMLVRHFYPLPEDEAFKEYLRREYGSKETRQK